VMGALPPPLRRGFIHSHAARGGWRGLDRCIPCTSLHVHVYWFRVGFHQCHRGVPWGVPCIPLHVYMCRFLVAFHRCHRGVERGETLRERSRLRWGVLPGLRRLPWVEELPAGRGGGAHRGGAGLSCGPGGGGAHGWSRWVKALHVPSALRLPGPAPHGQGIRMAVGRHELRARPTAPGCLLRVGIPHGRWTGQ